MTLVILQLLSILTGKLIALEHQQAFWHCCMVFMLRKLIFISNWLLY